MLTQEMNDWLCKPAEAPQGHSLRSMRAITASCVPLIPWLQVVALGSGGAEEFAGKAQGGLPGILVCS